MRVLVVEVDDRVASFLLRGLRAQGYAVERSATASATRARMRETGVDLVLLDLSLPDPGGMEVLRRLRQRGEQVPVIVLTGLADGQEGMTALDMGADDYLTKPLAFDELLARIRARLRRRAEPQAATLRAGRLELDLLARRAGNGERTVDLTAREFALLAAFFRRPGQVLSREQLLSQVWDLDFDPRSNVVEVYVRSLRRKLGKAQIETVRGMGYRLVTFS